MRTSRSVTAVFGLVAAFFFLARDLRAAACVWNGTSGDWTDTAQWSSCGGTFPGRPTRPRSPIALRASGQGRATKGRDGCLTNIASPEETS